MTQPFPLIEVSGPPRERGRQYGQQAAERIALGIRHYTQQLEGSRFDAAGIRELVHEYVPHMTAFEPAYVEEMRGIAEGAGVDFEAVALLTRARRSSSSAAIPPCAAGWPARRPAPAWPCCRRRPRGGG